MAALDALYAGATPTYAQWRSLLGRSTTDPLAIGPGGWLDQVIVGSERGMLRVLPSDGDNAAVFGTQSVNSLAGGAARQAAGIYVLNNNNVSLHTLRGVYAEARRIGLAGVTTGLEVSIVNQGDVQDVNPYVSIPWGGTSGITISSGRGDVPSSEASVGIAFRSPGPSRFGRGIDFGWNSVVSYPGVGAPVLSMATGHALAWWAPDSGIAAAIRSEITDMTGFAIPTAIIFRDTGLDIVTADDTVGVTIRNGAIGTTALSVGTSLLCLGPAFLRSTLEVDGGASIAGNLGVAGLATFTARVSLEGPIAMGNLPVFANDQESMFNGLAIGYAYFNTTIGAVTIRRV